MKKLGYFFMFCLCAASITVFGGKASAAEKTVYFTDTHEVLHGNPYSGMAFDINSHRMGPDSYTFTNDPAITAFIEGTKTIPEDADIVRLQIAWADFEPAKGVFVWDRLDRFMSRINEQGKTVEFQLLMSESPDVANDPGVFQYIYPPEWLFEDKDAGGAGASYRLAPYNEVYNAKQPIYYDPIFLDELQKAVDAFAARYDSNPGMAWVDMRAFALFGEWSGWNDASNFPWPDNATRKKTLEAIIDIYADAFTNTMVMMPNAGASVVTTDSEADTQEKRYQAFGFEYALANNKDWGLRSDTVNSAFPWMDYGPYSENVWINRLMRRDHIQVSEGASWDSSIMLNNPRMVVKNAIEAYHSNLQGINNAGFAEWESMKTAYGEWFTTLARYSGYRFVMPSATYNDKVAPGDSFTLTQTWLNNGAGFSPKTYGLKVYFTNRSTGAVEWSGTDSSLDQSKWFKGDLNEVRSSFVLPSDLIPGTYDLGIAMVDADGNPRISLAMPNGVGKIYTIGTIEVAASGDPYEEPSPKIQFRVEGENYTGSNYTPATRGAYGVEPPPEGGYGAVYMDTKDYWAEYSNVYVPVSGTYTAEFRVSTEAGNHFRFEVDGVDSLGSIVTPDSGGYNIYRTIERPIALSAGRHTIRIIRDDDRWFFMNWMRFTLASPDEIKIQAELPTLQDGTWLLADDAVEDDGTVGVSVIDTGDWLQYDGVQVARTGDYLFQMRYSTVNSDALKFKLLVDGADATGELSLDDTGGVKKMKTADFVVPLTAGTHSFKIVWTEAHSNIVWNWMKFNLQGSFSKTIEAEHYNMQWNLDKENSWEGMDTGVVVGDYSNNGQPVKAVGKFDRNDYVRYENVYVPYTGFYRFDFWIASDEAQSFRIEADGDSSTVAVPNTGGDGNFAKVSQWITLTAGIHDLRIVYNSQPTGSGMLLDKFTLTAGNAPVKGVVPLGASEKNVGETEQLTAEAVYMDGSRDVVTEGVIWLSSDPSVATIDSNGQVKALTWGTTTLTAIFEGVSGSYELKVTDPNVDLIMVNDDDPGVTYVGNVGADSGRPFNNYNGDIHYLLDKGDYYEYTFEGTGITVLTEKNTDVGVSEVYIDGELKGTVDGYWPSRLAQQPIFRINGLPWGEHTIRVVSTANFEDVRKFTMLDAFIVEQIKPWTTNSSLTATNVATTSLELNWTPVNRKATNYKIYNGSNEIGSVAGNVCTYRVAGLSPNTAYTFRVEARLPDETWTVDGPSLSVRTTGYAAPPTVVPDLPTLNQLTSAELNDLIKQAGASASITIDAQNNDSVYLPGNAGELLLQANKWAKITSNGHSIEIPTSVLIDLAKLLSVDEAKDARIKVSLTANEFAESDSTARFANEDSDGALKPNGGLYDFDLSIAADAGEALRLVAYNEPVLLRLKLEANRADAALLGIYALNETSHQWEYVGGKADETAGTIEAAITHNAKYAVMAFDKTYADVPSDHWAYNSIRILSARHVIEGLSSQRFGPAEVTTRAQFVTLLVRALGIPNASSQAGFADVAEGKWYAEAIAAAVQAGIVKGIDERHFAPDATISREEMAVLLVRAYEFHKGTVLKSQDELSKYSDAPKVSSWAQEEVNKAITAGFMQGRGQGTFVPEATTTRAETAAAILNLLNK